MISENKLEVDNMLLFGNTPRYGKSIGLYRNNIVTFNCHECHFLQRKHVSKHGFLYRCGNNVALTTKELKNSCTHGLRRLK